MVWTDPTSLARATVWIPSNSAATSACFSARTVLRSSSASRSKPAVSDSALSSMRARRSTRRWSLSVRLSTSATNTTAAAGPPPSTEANDPSTAETSRLSLSTSEKTTKAPPW